MRHGLRFTLLITALVALIVLPVAMRGSSDQPPDRAAAAAAQERQAAGGQAKPADQNPADRKPAEQKPADQKQEEELPPDFKAFNEAAAEKDPARRVELFEKFLIEHEESRLVTTVRSQIQSSALAALTSARKKYLDLIKADVEEAKKREETSPIYQLYNRLASNLLNAGLLEEAEEYARNGLDAMEEGKYVEWRTQMAQRALEAYEKAQAGETPEPARTPVGGFSISMVDGVMVVKPAPPRTAPTPPTPPRAPTIPTDEDLRAQFKSDRASALSTFGQILVKRGKQEEGEQALKEAFAARPSSFAMATIARILVESAKKAGNDEAQLEYLSELVLSGRFTAGEYKDLETVFRKVNGSTDGLEAMLDERYRRDNPRFDVTPYEREASPNQRVVLAEVFAGAG
jgi:tetratricopeptide (TPR) repeat protein